MNSHYIFAFVFAGMAAIGNAIFVYGQKRAIITENPFIFPASTLGLCTCLLLVTMIFFPKFQITTYFAENYLAILIGGIGLYITFIGFYYLYTGYGASYYSLYAVLSILTTSIFVGVWVFREEFNGYYGLSVVAAFVTIALFAMGQHYSSNQ